MPAKESFPSPLYTVDSVLFTYHECKIKVLLVQRSIEPEKSKWALPGGFVDLAKDETIEAAALRKLAEKTSVTPPYLDQLETRGNASRDPRGWSVTTIYSALIAHQACEQFVASVSDAQWLDLEELSGIKLAFDHRDIIESAKERMRQRALYSIVSGYALPESFTLSELQHLHEVLIGKPLQKRSFRRRIEQAGLLEEVGEKRHEGGRPAALYRLKDISKEFRFVRNLEAD